MRYDSIIIGAGPSGLAAAIRLAQHGRRVVVLERHDIWGGLSSFYSIGGRRLDVGLHALTNFVPPGTAGAPLTRILRQLRLSHADLRLAEQGFSEIVFPGLRLTFTNDFAHFEDQVAQAFPAERDRFARLTQAIRAYELGNIDRDHASGRALLTEYLDDEGLVEALLLPLCLYGSAREDDIDRGQLVTLFRAIFLEGLARPVGGIRTLLNLLVKRGKTAGAELRTKSGVARIHTLAGAVRGVELDDGTRLEADHVLSCAGYPETMSLCGEAVPPTGPEGVGRIAVLESISVLDRAPAALGHGAATSFFSSRPRYRHHRPAGLIDPTAGAIAAPTNFDAAADPASPDAGSLRLTTLANHDAWQALAPDEYAAAKERCADEAIAAAADHFLDWRPHTVFRDVFTPPTIRRFTGRAGGAIYGSPRKHPRGETGIRGLSIIGADQGLLGVVGALYSGILIANRHAVAGV